MIRISLLVLACIASLSGSEWEAITLEANGNGTNADEGPTWYRCHLQVPERLVVPEGANRRDLWRSSTMLVIADCPHPFEAFLNGKRIVQSEGVPNGTSQRFKVPKDIFVRNDYNALVLHLQKGALTQPPFVIDYFHEVALGPAWERTSTEPPVAAFASIASRPAHAVYTADDFRLSATPLDATVNPIPGKQLAPEAALATLKTEDDLTVELLLHEPRIAQPTHFSFDARGRLWVSQYRQYPYPKGLKMLSRDQYYRSHYDRVPPPPPHHDLGADIVSVHEDTDGDGFYDRHKRVLGGLNMANAALRGWGGLWVMHTPYLLFYPDADGDDLPDGPPEVRLAGFGLEDTHSVANGLTWGPDGWLYGGQGSTVISRVTRPDIDPTDAPGVYNEGCHVWRYHPHTKAFETFADGGGNIFGLSFDAEGRLFIGHNGGDTRGWHLVQGGQYLKQGKNPGKFGPPPNPYAFGEMPMMRSTHPIPRFSNMTIVIEGTAMPARLQQHFLGVDPLHHHLVAAHRRPLGSSFETTDVGFPIQTEEITFRPVFLNNAPDGSVYVADFCEEFIAHGQNYQGQIDPFSGRLYRLRGRARPLEADIHLEAKSNKELVTLLSHANLWHRHTAVRLLGQRGDVAILPELKDALQRSERHPALEALWAIHQMDQLSETLAIAALAHPQPPVRLWAIRLMGDRQTLPSAFRQALLTHAASEPDAEVRCQILATAGRLPVDQSLSLIEALHFSEGDANDPFLPLMLWFVLESHCEAHPDDVLALFEQPARWHEPVLAQHIVERLMRRFASAGTQANFLRCARLLERAPNEASTQALLEGFEKAFQGRIPPLLPESLVAATGRGSLSMRIRQGDADAIDQGLQRLREDQSDRLEAIHAFGTRAIPAAQSPLLAIATQAEDASERHAALTALQIYTDPTIATALIDAYSEQVPELKTAILNLLASRRPWATQLIESTQIPRQDLVADIRARLAMHDLNLPEESIKNGGLSTKERVTALTTLLRAQPGDPYRGETLYATRCGTCHKLFFKGGAIGPDLTQYQRQDLPTLLHSILDPNAEIREGYENIVIRTHDHRLLSGFLVEDGAHAIVLRMLDGANATIPRADIRSMKPTGRSLMPEGLLAGLTDQQLRDLFAYLRIPQPISP